MVTIKSSSAQRAELQRAHAVDIVQVSYCLLRAAVKVSRLSVRPRGRKGRRSEKISDKSSTAPELRECPNVDCAANPRHLFIAGKFNSRFTQPHTTASSVRQAVCRTLKRAPYVLYRAMKSVFGGVDTDTYFVMVVPSLVGSSDGIGEGKFSFRGSLFGFIADLSKRGREGGRGSSE